MLKKIENPNDKYPAFTYVGNNGNYYEYIVPIRENANSNKDKDYSWEDLERELREDNESMEFTEEYYNYNWNDTPAAEEDEKTLTRYDFLNMDFKECQYHIYKQLVNISSFLSKQDVVSDGNKSK